MEETYACDETRPDRLRCAPFRQRLGLRDHRQEEDRGPGPPAADLGDRRRFLRDPSRGIRSSRIACKPKEGDVVYRTLSLKGGGTIKEKLTATKDNGYSYEILESPLPVKNYKARLWLEVDDEPERSVILWQSDFDANGASDDDARKKITEIFAAGVKGIKQKAIAAYDAREAAAGKTPAPEKDDDKDE